MSLWQYTAAVAGYAKANESEEDRERPDPPTLADLNLALANSRS